jgi:hypothetical protein
VAWRVGPVGVGEQGMRAKVPQEPGRPSHFHRPTGKGNPVTNPGPAAWRPTPAGEEKEAGARW